jgi:molybdate transport repressor ModE-like protein
MQNAHDVLTPDALAMLQAIASCGSFAGAARQLGVVPSALTYRVRQMEDVLDVLLYDRSARPTRLTPAGAELLHEGARLLADMQAVANRLKRVATGWESQFTIAVDSIIIQATLMDLCTRFFALNAPTRLKLRDETLSGTLEALSSGQADLALGVTETSNTAGILTKPLSQVRFVYAVAAQHQLANAPEPLSDDVIRQHRAVAVADTISRGAGITIGLLGGQDVFTVATMQAKLDAQLRGLGAGFVPESLAHPYITAGQLVVKRVEREARSVSIHYAWHQQHQADQGRALQWWLAQLENPLTRSALLARTPPQNQP